MNRERLERERHDLLDERALFRRRDDVLAISEAWRQRRLSSNPRSEKLDLIGGGRAAGHAREV
ncbi:MAG TPA: hypothetical protein VG328_07075 [Stellaceae bacterium]|nr:hypothetical protein [Stellaceae bacterium]